ncbi:MAG: dihydropteroate synthase [Deltaproteobacteria bacterium]|nr:dihydropteroate synthase [Deltaproteobacteria bacterium]
MQEPRPETPSGAPSASPRVLVMGIVNVTPDSFSDGGRFPCAEAAIEHGLALVAEGADWLDVGGESTRPGSRPVSEAEERERVLPVIEGLAKRTETPISIDTRRAAVAAAALAAGARIVNAVVGLRDAELAAVCAEHGATLVLNHIRGEPASMQHDPVYGDVVREVRDELLAEASLAQRAGVARERIWLDPGLGFGKHPLRHNLPLLGRLDEIVATGYPILVGASRKQFIGALTGAPVSRRLHGSLAAAVAAVLAGARAVRAHDVAETRQAVDVASAIRAARAPERN